MHNSLWLWSLYFLKFYVEISPQKKSNLFVMFYVMFSASSREWPFCWSRERLISIILYICLVVNLFQKRVCESLRWALLVYNETSAKYRWQSSRFEGVFNVDWNFVQRYLFYLVTQVEVKQGVKVAIFRKKCIDFRFLIFHWNIWKVRITRRRRKKSCVKEFFSYLQMGNQWVNRNALLLWGYKSIIYVEV